MSGYSMEIAFDCECGEEVSDFTRGEGSEISAHLQCDSCGAVYAVTITPLQRTDQ